MKVVFAERARCDIGEIYDYIAQQNRQATQHVEDMIRASCESLANFPSASSPPTGRMSTGCLVRYALEFPAICKTKGFQTFTEPFLAPARGVTKIN
jgi:plasmid stabilization system protein ParE